jgi:polar amino acid transport system substrate-binding protein
VLRIISAVFAWLIIASSSPVDADTIVVAVEDKDWSPYYYWIDGEPHGPCPEIAGGAIRQMGAEVKFVRYPWVRVLQSVEQKKVDAGLCGTKNDERAAYSYYPEEALLNYDVTLFVRRNSPIGEIDKSRLDGKSFALVKGYNFGNVDLELESLGMIRIETPNRESLLKLLLIERVDTVLDSSLPMHADARRLGVSDQIRALVPSLAETPGYLFFSRKPGHEELAKRFSDSLREFKESPEYTAIRERYGL